MEDNGIALPYGRRLEYYDIPEQVEKIKKFVYIIEVI